MPAAKHKLSKTWSHSSRLAQYSSPLFGRVLTQITHRCPQTGRTTYHWVAYTPAGNRLVLTYKSAVAAMRDLEAAANHTKPSEFKAHAVIRQEKCMFTGSFNYVVSIIWNGPGFKDSLGFSWGIGSQNPDALKLAERLKACIDSNTCFTSVCASTNVNGIPYVSASLPVVGRTMDADLRALGF